MNKESIFNFDSLRCYSLRYNKEVPDEAQINLTKNLLKLIVRKAYNLENCVTKLVHTLSDLEKQAMKNQEHLLNIMLACSNNVP